MLPDAEGLGMPGISLAKRIRPAESGERREAMQDVVRLLLESPNQRDACSWQSGFSVGGAAR